MENIPQEKYSKEKFDRIKARFYDFMLSLPEEDYDYIQEILKRKAADLREKYPNATSYAMYHVFTLSGVSERTVEYEDFPREDSVELFIDNLINQR